MERGLFIAASGMLAAQIRQDVIANNLANATNPGFKGEVLSQVAFGDLLLSSTQTGATVGPLNTGTQVTDDQAEPREQGVPLDAEHARPRDRRQRLLRRPDAEGVRYTRDGAFTTDAKGFLITGRRATRCSARTASRLDLSGGGRI